MINMFQVVHDIQQGPCKHAGMGQNRASTGQYWPIMACLWGSTHKSQAAIVGDFQTLNSLSSTHYFLESTNKNVNYIFTIENLRMFKYILQKKCSLICRQEISIGLRNGLAPIWCQRISKSNDAKNLCCMDAACEENELIGHREIVHMIGVLSYVQIGGICHMLCHDKLKRPFS